MVSPVDDVVVVRAGAALVCFAEAAASPRGANEHGLAEMARVSIGSILGCEVSALYALQEHGFLTYVYESDQPLEPGAHCVGACDGLITPDAGVALVVRNADCLPVALVAPSAVAMLHAGWRGLAADILGRAVRRLENEFGVHPSEIEAWIGPAVDPCHYEVGPEVVLGLAQHLAGQEGWEADGRVDLRRYAASRLTSLGVSAVSVVGPCTACSPRHHSFRRDGSEAGRMWSAVIRLPTGSS